MTDEPEQSEQSSQEEPFPLKMQNVPLVCPQCSQSAYLIDAAMALSAGTVTVDMLTRTDERALEPHHGMALQCPYCGEPLARAVILPVVGGGWVIRFRWHGLVAETQ